MITRSAYLHRARQRGAAVLEIALSLLILSLLLVGFIDATRWLHAMNAASEATRLGARLASICERSSDSAQAIRNQMRFWLPDLSADRASSVIRIGYEDPPGVSSASCDASTCRQVSVWLEGYAIPALGGLVPGGALPLPSMRSSVVRESLQSRTGTCAPSH